MIRGETDEEKVLPYHDRAEALIEQAANTYSQEDRMELYAKAIALALLALAERTS